MLAELQRCRRMVASMRGLVMASSVRAQLLQDAQLALAARDERQRRQLQQANGSPPPSPRTRYLRYLSAKRLDPWDFRDRRICVIQRQWRKYRWQRLVIEKIKMERKWRSRRGNPRMEQSATVIQRALQRYCSRKRRDSGLPTLAKASGVFVAKSRIDRLRGARFLFHSRIESLNNTLHQGEHDLDTTRNAKISTEAMISTASTLATRKPQSLLVDAKLLDGTVVRMEAHQFLVHLLGEEERLIELTTSLRKEIEVFGATHPTTNRAASLIQTLFRRYQHVKSEKLQLQRKRYAQMGLRISSDRCYERMNASFLKNQRAIWDRSATIIKGLYHIIIAKRLLHLKRQIRAVAIIERAYRQRRDRIDAQARVKWRRIELRAQLFTLRRIQRFSEKLWCGWRKFVDLEKCRRSQISKLMATGHERWIASKATRMQRLFRRAVALRRSLADRIIPVLNLVLRNVLDSAVASSSDPREQFLRFYQQIVQDMKAWQTPKKKFAQLAQRYGFQLDKVPLEDIWTWISDQAQRDVTTSSSWHLDLRAPYTIRTLRFLGPLSYYYDLHDKTLVQIEQIWIYYEAAQVVRHYLCLLFTHNLVTYTDTSVFTASQRKRAVDRLNALLQRDSLDSEGNAWIENTSDAPFTTFHCLWTDLCEKCLSLVLDIHERACSNCGHRHVELSTESQPSHSTIGPLIDRRINDSELSTWIRETERCDFLIVNAFFHALAPRGHANRELYTPDTLWKASLAKACEPVSRLYDACAVRTLNDMLTWKDLWGQIFPEPVAAKLKLFTHIMRQEIVGTHNEATSWN